MAFVVVKIGAGEFAVNVDVNCTFKILFDLLLGFLDGQLWFQVALSVKLRRLNKTFVTTSLIGSLEHNTISRDLLPILKQQNVTDLNVSEASFHNVFVPLLKCSNF